MSTTKHLILTERPGTHIEIVNADGRPAIIVTDNYKSTMAYFEPADGAKTALAILESAGVEPSSPHYGLNDSPEWNLRWASHYLGRSIELTNAHAAEAKKQAELEAEAIAYRNASASLDWNYREMPIDEFRELAKSTRDKWLAVARRAREINKETPNV